MFRFYMENMPALPVLEQQLRRYGKVAMLNMRTLRLIPSDSKFPPIYINKNGAIEMNVSSLDLFQREDCVEKIEEWFGVS
jgi:hypothetical protein